MAPDTTGVGVVSGCSVGSGASVGSPVGAGDTDGVTVADQRNVLVNQRFMGKIQQTFLKKNIIKDQELSLFTLFSIIVC